MTIGDRIGFAALCLIAALFQPSFLMLPTLILPPVIVWIAIKVDQKRSERQRLASDADYQHARLMTGNTYLGVYGRFPVA